MIAGIMIQAESVIGQSTMTLFSCVVKFSLFNKFIHKSVSPCLSETSSIKAKRGGVKAL